MRWTVVCLGLTLAFGAEVPFRVIAVERRGPPPYEQADRIYVLNGGQAHGLHVGDRLILRRSGEGKPIGHLRVNVVRGDRAETAFDGGDKGYPMKGDTAQWVALSDLPSLSGLNADSLPGTVPPRPSAVAPPREGLLFFLPQRADLSPAGLLKLGAWVQEWGSGGRWAVQVPTVKAISPVLQKQRTEAVLSALRNLGVQHVTEEHEPRTTDGKYDPAWVRHWE